MKAFIHKQLLKKNWAKIQYLKNKIAENRSAAFKSRGPVPPVAGGSLPNPDFFLYSHSLYWKNILDLSCMFLNEF